MLNAVELCHSAEASIPSIIERKHKVLRFHWGSCFVHLCGKGSCSAYSTALFAIGVGGALGYIITDSMIEAYKKADFRSMYGCGVANILSVVIAGLGVAIIGVKVHHAIQKGYVEESQAELDIEVGFLP